MTENKTVPILIDQVYKNQERVDKLEIAVAKHDVKLNLIAAIASATLIGVVSVIIKLIT